MSSHQFRLQSRPWISTSKACKGMGRRGRHARTFPNSSSTHPHHLQRLLKKMHNSFTIPRTWNPIVIIVVLSHVCESQLLTKLNAYWGDIDGRLHVPGFMAGEHWHRDLLSPSAVYDCNLLLAWSQGTHTSTDQSKSQRNFQNIDCGQATEVCIDQLINQHSRMIDKLTDSDIDTVWLDTHFTPAGPFRYDLTRQLLHNSFRNNVLILLMHY
jgi:hypothetical protein